MSIISNVLNISPDFRTVRSYLSNSVWSAFDTYQSLTFTPSLVLDFEKEFYGVNNVQSTLAAATTHTRASNATMVDSDGLLKWAPHNLAGQSENSTLWGKNGMSVTSDSGTPPTGYSVSDLVTKLDGATRPYFTIAGGAASTEREFFAIVKNNGCDFLQISYAGGANSDSANYDISTGVVGSSGAGVVAHSIEDLGFGWYKCHYKGSIASASTGMHLGPCETATSARLQTYTSTGSVGFFVAVAQYNRADLGGMVNNPATGDSYVPTTDAAVYLPRTGHHIYNGTTWANEGLLLESEARTNLALNSNDFSASSWDNHGDRLAMSKNIVGIYGTANSATHVTFTGADSSRTAYLTYTVGGSLVPYTISVYMKKAEHDFGVISTGSYARGFYAVFDLVAGNVAREPTDAQTSAKIINVGNGWFRCTLTTTDTGGNEVILITSSPDNDIMTAASSGDGIYITSAQYEAGSTLSSYIPTSGAAATRAAETLVVPAANMPTYTDAVSIAIEGKMTYADTSNARECVFTDWGGLNNTSIYSALNTNGARSGQVAFYQNNVIFDFLLSDPTAYAPGINVAFNIASRHGSTFLNGAVEGTALTANTTPTSLVDLSSADFAIGKTFMGTLSELRVWPEDITDAGIEEASA